MPNQGEVRNAQTVKVQLADGKEVLLSQSRAGTLMPVASSPDENVAPIVPLRDLVQTLGCDVSWTRREGLVVKHPVHGRMSTQVSGKCPIIGETSALELISEIETQKLKESERANEEGHLRTILEGTAELREWKDFLSAYNWRCCVLGG